MQSEWAYLKRHFTAEQCDTIISKALQLPEQKAKMGPDNSKVSDWRRSTIRGIMRTPEWEFLYKEIDEITAKVNDEWFQLDYSHLPAIQFASYNEKDQGCYKRHCDTFLAPLPTHRKISFTVQLSDENSYEGGDLCFYDVCSLPNQDNMRLRGTVCFFPSIVFHEVTPVTKGIRHSLAGWYEGPHWR